MTKSPPNNFHVTVVVTLLLLAGSNFYQSVSFKPTQ